MRRDAPVWHVGNDFVFPTEMGTPQFGRDVLGEFKRLLRRAGLPETYRVDDLRHSTAKYDILGAPIIKPLLGKAAVPDDSPYTTGSIGLRGPDRLRKRSNSVTRC